MTPRMTKALEKEIRDLHPGMPYLSQLLSELDAVREELVISDTLGDSVERLYRKAKSEIEQLRAENLEMRSALKLAADFVPGNLEEYELQEAASNALRLPSTKLLARRWEAMENVVEVLRKPAWFEIDLLGALDQLDALEKEK